MHTYFGLLIIYNDVTVGDQVVEYRHTLILELRHVAGKVCLTAKL